jgi:hypothetical protein
MASVFARRPMVVIVIFGLLLACEPEEKAGEEIQTMTKNATPTVEANEQISINELLALDRAFGEAYKAMLEKQIPGDWPKLENARLWRVPLADGISPHDRRHKRQIMVNAYRDHIQTLLDMPIDLNPETPVKGLVVQMNDVSPQYDFTLRLFSPCLFMYDDSLPCVCRELGQLIVRRKGEAKILQVFTQQFWIEFDENGKPKDFTSFHGYKQDGYGNQIETFARDINFDGHEDLVLEDMRNNSLLFAYLFDPEEEHFVYFKEMSALLTGGYGLSEEIRAWLPNGYTVSVDPEEKHIQTYWSGESCSSANWSQTIEWQVKENQPIPATRKTTDLGLCADGQDNGRDYCYVAITEGFVDGAWQEVGKKYTPCTMVEDDDEGPIDHCIVKTL